MWPFSKQPDKAGLQGHKTVVINGSKYVIRRVNPFLDFPPDSIPQLFTDVSARRQPDPAKIPDAAKQKNHDDIKNFVYAGLVSPALVQIGKGENKGREPGITVDDIFRDPDTGIKLYLEILVHSLNHFRGVRGFFTSIRLRLSLWTVLRNAMEELRQKLSYQTEVAL